MMTAEEALREGLAAIDHIKYCGEQLATLSCMTTTHDESIAAMDSLICRVDDLPMDCENIRDDAKGDE